jgi:oxygen-dependent protoporphyrinogen oxidase
MRSQLPEHALGTLLGQCFKSLRCQSARSCWPTFSRCSRSLHTSPPSGRRRVTPSFEKQYKQFQTQSGHSADGASSPLQIVSAEAASHHDYVLRAEQHGQTGEGQPHHGTRIAVLGGGITGLASAHYLAKELPYAKITVYEKSDRLGGWLQSKKVDVGNGNVLFEQGPRSLRPGTPSGLVTLEIVGSDIHLFFQMLNSCYRSRTSVLKTNFS